ncbi:MAG: DNA topoisomerase 3 [Clostridium sp.]|nr:DNA topoisomerase 3 [Clostridium sp.]
MILCITEKPSVARDIAEILGATIKRDGYFQGPEACPYVVTWTFGHLCCLKEPGDYSEYWKRWSLGQLPMIPPKFGIKVIPEEYIEKQFKVIETLSKGAEKIINCGDAGQEGELIQRWVMQKAGVKCPVLRFWTSSLTEESIRASFADLKPESEYQNLYMAGLSRAIGDWLLGMNATRLYSLKYSSPGNVLSIGRVQTPTLALIVQRHHEIENFTPEDYWELRTLYRDVTFTAPGKKYSKIEEAQAVVDRIANSPLTVTDVAEKKGKEAPPRLFDLTSLQVECNKRWGWTADETLRLIQSLYEKKVTTYPRVDTTYLSDDIYAKVPKILKDMTPYANATAPLLAMSKLPKSKKVFDSSKVTDHHAIIPTGQPPQSLVGNERQLYHLIALRFIAAFYPDCAFTTTTVMAKAEDIAFKASGKVINDPGWRALYANDKTQAEEKTGDDDRILPPFTKGESGPHKPSALKKTTQPPKYYNEGTLLRAMETAGKTVDDEELREAMKENGIGRPSTRAAIIETLFKRRYIYRERKNIMASQAGIALINTIREELLKSAKLTGIWENKLRRIERGSYQASEFISELKAMVSEIVVNVMSDNSNFKIDVGPQGGKGTAATEKSKKPTPKTPTAGGAAAAKEKPKRTRRKKVETLEAIKCPKCKKGHLLRGRTAYGCSRYAEGCDFRLDFATHPASLSPQELYDKIQAR